jgi:hypothetical protein
MKETKTETPVIEETESQNETISLQDASVEQLKAAAFDIDQNIKVLQNQYQTIISELQNRVKEE